eukprot:COSAG05_NODE_977_length_6332_cov_10.027755_2_plen_58_part_00
MAVSIMVVDRILKRLSLREEAEPAIWGSLGSGIGTSLHQPRCARERKTRRQRLRRMR